MDDVLIVPRAVYLFAVVGSSAEGCNSVVHDQTRFVFTDASGMHAFDGGSGCFHKANVKVRVTICHTVIFDNVGSRSCDRANIKVGVRD